MHAQPAWSGHGAGPAHHAACLPSNVLSRGPARQVVLAVAEVLGALSPLRLPSIGKRWADELGRLIVADANSPARQQLYDLCHGLRCVRLCAGTAAQLEASTEFLRLAHPLTHVAPDKKSRVQQVGGRRRECRHERLARRRGRQQACQQRAGTVQGAARGLPPAARPFPALTLAFLPALPQAICDMLAGVLQPLADLADPSTFGADLDPALRQTFSQQVPAPPERRSAGVPGMHTRSCVRSRMAVRGPAPAGGSWLRCWVHS